MAPTSLPHQERPHSEVCVGGCGGTEARSTAKQDAPKPTAWKARPAPREAPDAHSAALIPGAADMDDRRSHWMKPMAKGLPVSLCSFNPASIYPQTTLDPLVYQARHCAPLAPPSPSANTNSSLSKGPFSTCSQQILLLPVHGCPETSGICGIRVRPHWPGPRAGRNLLRDMWTVASRRYSAFCRGSGWKPLLVK